MAKKKERISENLSDYATDFEEWFSFDYATDFEEWFSLDYSKLMPSYDAKPKQSDDPNAGKSVQVKKTVNQHAMRRVLSELALEKELPWQG